MQTAIDCHSRYAWVRLYTSKLPVTAVHLMNSAILPTFEAHKANIDMVLPDNGREFCGRPGQHPYELFHRIGERDMPRRSKKRSARCRMPQQIDLFAGEPQITGGVPAWSGLPTEAQAALINLMIRLILHHADKERIVGMTEGGHDH